MVEKDIERWQIWKRGESFPWDAIIYPSEDKIISRELTRDRS